LLAGPIERAGTFIAELRKEVVFDGEQFSRGVQLITWGLFKKMVVADRVATYVDQVFLNPDGQGLHIVFAAYLYAFQIYCDFSGYSDIAVGICRTLGMNSLRNFNSPYASRSISEFWARWHISLSTWFRDYVYLPTAYAVVRRIPGDTLLGVSVESWGYAIATSLSMLLCGLWHGASWVFVFWGGMHGAFLLVSHFSRAPRRQIVKRLKLRKLRRARHALAVILTFNLVSLSWVFFRSQTLSDACRFLGQIRVSLPSAGLAWLGFSAILVAVFSLMEYVQRNPEQCAILARLPRPLKVGAFALFVCLIIVFAVDTENEFIYSQF
jgi:D-alanyl-lipoteichoic acid acyltransferase DltB (MBOAT superfamily)